MIPAISPQERLVLCENNLPIASRKSTQPFQSANLDDDDEGDDDDDDGDDGDDDDDGGDDGDDGGDDGDDGGDLNLSS